MLRTLLLSRPLLRTALPLRFAAAKKGGASAAKAQGKGAAPQADEAAATAAASAEPGKKVIPINIYKEGEDPVELPDSEYPEWLWELTERELSLEELENIDPKERTPYQLYRIARVSNRHRITANNEKTVSRWG